MLFVLLSSRYGLKVVTTGRGPDGKNLLMSAGTIGSVPLENMSLRRKVQEDLWEDRSIIFDVVDHVGTGHEIRVLHG